MPPIPVFPCTRHTDHPPLALGMLRAYAEQEGLDGVRFFPFVDSANPAATKQARAFGPGIWLFSNYVWSEEDNLALSAYIKTLDPRNITIHGGPSTPAYAGANAAFLRRHPHVDFCVRGEGELTAYALLRHLVQHWGEEFRTGAEAIAGISFRNGDEVVRTPDRPRLERLDQLPSPYLAGLFDGQHESYRAAIVESNRGCPFGCTFCDWGSSTRSKVKRFDLPRVIAEITWAAQREIPTLWLADANFGMLSRDAEIAAAIAECKRRYGYPHEVVVNYAKSAHERLAVIVQLWHQVGIACQGVISLQTRDADTLATIGRANIKNAHFERLLGHFRRMGLPVSVDLMIGLPGATPAAFADDLQYCFEQAVTAKAYRTRLLVNSPMAEPDYRRRHAIKTDASGRLLACTSYKSEALNEMIDLWQIYRLMVNYALLEPLLHQLQWDGQIKAVTLLERLALSLRQHPHRFRHLITQADHPGRLDTRATLAHNLPDWSPLYAELAAWLQTTFAPQLEVATGWRCAMALSEALMPRRDTSAARKITLAHDYLTYANERRGGGSARSLDHYPPTILRIAPPDAQLNEAFSFDAKPYNTHSIYWQLDCSHA